MEKAGEVSVQMGDRTGQVPNNLIGPASMHGNPVKWETGEGLSEGQCIAEP